MKGRAAAAALITAAAAALLSAPARADITVVQRTLTGIAALGARDTPLTVTAYYKGERCREECRGSSFVHLYDAEKGVCYTLNRIDKTYSVAKREDALAAGGVRAWATLAAAGMATVTSGGGGRDILGRHAANYVIQSRVILSDARHAATVLTAQIDGEQWTCDTLSLPSKSEGIAESAYLFAPRAIRLLEPYLSKAGEMKGLPLSSDYIFTLSGAIDGTFEAQIEVKSISEAPLPDSLFNVPPAYQIVDKINEGELSP